MKPDLISHILVAINSAIAEQVLPTIENTLSGRGTENATVVE